MTGAAKSFWAKLSRDRTDRHPLVDHSADVAAVCEALLRDTLLGRRLARLGGLERLDARQPARLCVLAAYHDVGKFSIGFQNLAQEGRHPRIGHLPAVFRLRQPMLGQVLDALDYKALISWGFADGHFCSTIAHHGLPFLDYDHRESLDSRVWEPVDGLAPLEGITALRGLTKDWFPQAWEPGGDALPNNEAFLHGWNGILNLADWIGSNEQFFPFSKPGECDRMEFARERAAKAVARLGLRVEPLRQTLGPKPPELEEMYRDDGFKARPSQAALLGVEPPEDSSSLAILEAETGAGKTEAALLYFLRLFHAGLVDSLYFALPTRTAATQIYNRTCDAVNRVFPEGKRPPVVQAVSGYLKVDGVAGRVLEDDRVVAEDEGEFGWDPFRGWAAERPKRFLAGTVAVGTVDQALLSALRVRHCHLRGASLLRSLLVVDEVHASDEYMTRILQAVLRRHLLAGSHALLMSATLGSSAAAGLLQQAANSKPAQPTPEEAAALSFPLIRIATPQAQREIPVAAPDFNKQVEIEMQPWLDEPEQIARLALDAASNGAAVLVVRNTVGGCLKAQQALEDLSRGPQDERLFRCRGQAAPHHGRYSGVDRRMLDDLVEEVMGRKRAHGPRVVVGTQTLEQSLDLDADLLITDLCPIDVLLQRIGRLHRHQRDRAEGFGRARVVVLCPPRPLLASLRDNGEFRGGHGLGPVYVSAIVLELTLRELKRRGSILIPRDNRSLVESATHKDLVRRFAEDEGGLWKKHLDHILGDQFSKKRIAQEVLVDWSQPYLELQFKSDEKKIRTRLGLDDRMVSFPRPVPSPFDGNFTFEELKIPRNFAPEDAEDELRAENVEAPEASLRFSIGDSRFLYNRLGLNREKAA
ncbi:MAG TPA: CRISPR-associated helicase Cas3' [Acidobacteriota bacterium]|nr:CRISPR-associated helicase Cas3' [Acidobacteriota bacterium]